MNVLDWRLRDTGYAVVALHTTGLTVGFDRLVEIAVVRGDPGAPLQLALDTLVNPGRPVGGTPIHGINDLQVSEAPAFLQVAGDLARSFVGRVVAVHGMSTVWRLLVPELVAVSFPTQVAVVDTLAMCKVLGLGARLPLGEACRAVGLTPTDTTLASDHALDAGRLLRALLQRYDAEGVSTFGQLAAVCEGCEFAPTMQRDVLYSLVPSRYPESVNRVSRRALGFTTWDPRQLTYWRALVTALADLEVTPEELAQLRQLHARLELAPEDLHGLHAQVFAASLHQAIGTGRIDAEARAQLKKLKVCLTAVGWCPGD